MTSHHCGRFRTLNGTRRDMLTSCATGFGAVALSALAANGMPRVPLEKESPLSPRPTHFDARARSIIFLYMDGGVSQVDSFDPKPELERQNGKPFPVGH